MATAAQCKTFIETIGPIIQAHAQKAGFRTCSAIIAQACCESAFGTSSLGYRYHNYFGMKCGSSWKGASVNMKTREEYTPGKLTQIRDNFRAYASMDEGVAGYFAFTNSKRYANLKTAKDFREYAKLVKDDGWATSSTYTTTLITLVERYQLDRFDDFSYTVPSAEPTAPAYQVGRNYTLQTELNVRTGPGTNYPRKGHSALTAGGKRNDKDKDGALDKGTVVTCQELRTVGSAIWMRCPSGWLCARTGTKIYIC